MIVESVSSPSGGKFESGRIAKLVNGIQSHETMFTSTIKQSDLNSLRVSKKAPLHENEIRIKKKNTRKSGIL